MNMQVLDTRRDTSGGYKVDVSRGSHNGRVSSEWFSRPADERYLSLNELMDSVRGRAERSRTRVVESALIHVEASRTDAEHLSLILPGSDTPVAPTHWSFGQLASQVGAPAAYLRQLPAALAGINLQYGLTSNRAEQIKTLETDDGRVELRAVTGPDYGRIYDYELVEAVQRIAGNGTGDTRWKVPGVCRTVRPTSTSGASMSGIRKLEPKRSAWPVSISGRSAKIAICGASRISRKSPSDTPNMPRPVSRTRRLPRC